MTEKEPSVRERIARQAMRRTLVEKRDLPFGIKLSELIDLLVSQEPSLEKELPDNTTRLSRIRKELQRELDLLKRN